MASFFVLGEYFGAKVDLRCSQLSEIRLGIGFLRGDMEFNLSPAAVSAEKISERLNEPVKGIFKDFSERLKAGETIEKAWIRALTGCYEKTFFKAEDIEALYPLGKIIECLDIEKQDRGLKLITDYIEEKTNELKTELYRVRRLYRSFSVLTGLLASVLLL
ncbi:MAG: stage III sporulation protein AB [Clostridiales bacterium]|nr:stage III sporulation protein AB [Clostridiales bacterium]